MNRTTIVRRNDRGVSVKNLQSALLVLLRRKFISIPDAERKPLEVGLSRELKTKTYGPLTVAAVTRVQRELRLPANGDCDAPTVEALNRVLDQAGLLNEQGVADQPYEVRGTVRHASGSPHAGVTVVALAKQLRTETPLAEDSTNRLGQYRIAYDADRFQGSAKASPGLRVAVRAADGRELATSNVIFQPQRVEVVDFTTGSAVGEGTEFKQIVADIRQTIQTLAIADLTDQDLLHLAETTGRETDELSLLVQGHKLAREAELAPEILYGFLRSGLPASLAGIAGSGPRLQRAALEKAVTEKWIPSRFRNEIDAAVSRGRTLVQRHIVDDPAVAKHFPIVGLLGKTPLTRQQQTLTVQLSAEHEGTAEQFWASLRARPDLRDQVDAIQTSMRLGFLTQNHGPLMDELQTRLRDRRVASLQDLARLDRSDWKTMLAGLSGGRRIGFPDDIPGANDSEKTENYAAALEEIARAAFPMAAVAGRLSRDTAPLSRTMAEFLDRNADFDLGDTHIDAFLRERPAALPASEERAATVDRLKTMQRLYRVTPKFENMHALEAAGIGSAHEISQLSQTSFVRQFGGLLGGEWQARAIHGRAQMLAGTAQLAAVSTVQAIHDYLPIAISKPAIETLPNWATLFGSGIMLECAQCRSVHSPAAYLVDVLQFLRYGQRTNGKTPLDVLLERRPDIQHLRLTCENTNTPLPYVDLVIEALEGYTAHRQLRALNTSAEATAEELSVNREYTPESLADAEAAYAVLARQVYPPGLPFDRPLDVVRTYLTHLGGTRHELMRAFQGVSGPSAIDIACEELAVSPVEWAILTGAPLNPPRALQEFFGYPAQNAGNWQQNLVAQFGTRMNLSPADVEELSKSSAVVLRLDALTAEMLEKAHRFIRLARKVGWSLSDLDRAMTALGEQAVTGALLEKLAAVRKLSESLRKPLPMLLGLFANLGASVYAGLFQNKAVRNPVDPAFALNPLGTELSNPTPPLAGHVPAILQALEITGADLDRIRDAEGIDASAPLNLASLSALHRNAFLAHALRISVDDLVDLRLLTGLSPFQAGSPEAALTFIRTARKVKASRFSVAQLNYVLRDVTNAGEALGLETAQVEEVLGKIRDGLQKITSDTPAELDLQRRGVVKQLLSTSLKLEPSILTALLGDNEGQAAIIRGMNPQQTAMEEFLTIASQPAGEAHARLLRRLHKVALIVNGFALSAKEIVYLSLHREDFGGLDWNTIPVEPQGSTAVLFGPWARIAEFCELRAGVPEASRLLDLFGAAASGAPLDDLLATIAEITGWEATAVRAAVEGLPLAATDFRNDVGLARLRDCLQLSRRLGIGVPLLLEWARQAPDAAQADAVVNTAKAKYSETQWLEIARPLNDSLRERQRQALVAYVLSLPELRNAGVKEPNDLFQFFLIDTEMRPGASTSRIKQANSSLQLFVQRCLMSLEPDVAADALDGKQWNQWMKYYRVWEANRKVFLYPENWIEPELRDGKSPFFENLEKDLLSDEINDDTVERALKAYLGKLDDVARLEIAGLCTDDDSATVHLIGRTPNASHTYYHRRLDRATAVWTPWEKIPIDFQGEGAGDQLIPVIYNRRLYVFWPLFAEKPDEDQPESPEHKQWRTEEIPNWEEEVAAWEEYNETWESAKESVGDEWVQLLPNPGSKPQRPAEPSFSGELPPNTHWDVRLAWTEFRDKKWTARQLSKEALRSSQIKLPSSFGSSKKKLPDKMRHIFRVDLNETALRISVSIFRAITTNSYVSDVTPIGTFRLEECRGGLAVEAKQENNYPLTFAPELCYPQRSMFSSVGAGQGLILYGWDIGRLELLGSSNGKFRTVPPSDYVIEGTDSLYPFVYQDRRRTYWVEPEMETANNVAISSVATAAGLMAASAAMLAKPNGILPGKLMAQAKNLSGGAIAKSKKLVSTNLSAAGMVALLPVLEGQRKHRFSLHLHPFVCDWIKDLARGGITGLLTLDNQRITSGGTVNKFESAYEPTENVHNDRPTEDVDFDRGAAYELYNWELFFHVPLLIATQLSGNQRFAEAQRWFHYIFDPTSGSAGSVRSYWRVLPFWRNLQPQQEQIQELLALLSTKDSSLSTAQRKRKKRVAKQVAEWRANPFQPHLIARLRITAYQKTVVMKYIDNLIAWADQLFARDTLESINEATHLYVLAADLLGPRPVVAPAAAVDPETYASLRQKGLDSFSNAFVQLENEIVIEGGNESAGGGGDAPQLHSLYFCIPGNETMLRYWDVVADRLFKIRHSLNIEGLERQLPLFEPPIDPAILVRAAAMGVDLNSVMNDLSAPLPHYRFQVMVQRAQEICSELKSLSGALLGALEKRDAEALSALRSNQEIQVLSLMRTLKDLQISEATETLESLKQGKEMIERRHQFYRDIKFMSEAEIAHSVLSVAAAATEVVVQAVQSAASPSFMIPTITVGVAGVAASPVQITVAYSGEKQGSSIESAAKAMGIVGTILREAASQTGTMAAYQRRWDEWKLQEKLAKKELDQVEHQISAAEIRRLIAERDLKNHESQIENAKAADEFLRSKFTNEELYMWMSGELSRICFQTYKLAYDAAKRAELAYRHELGIKDSSFIQFGYWDSLRKGLLAGDRLGLDLQRMQSAFIEKNRREYEITKHVSLIQNGPLALLALKQTGTCEIEIKEPLYDLDFPGQYFRRIKSVSLSIPCVTGPYTSVNCTLSLLRSEIRSSSSLDGGYLRTDADDTRFTDIVGSVQSTALSHGQRDSGIFEFSFRDERYLPFEGAGAISTWRIELPHEFRQFDYDTISDVILHVNYTARQGGAPLKQAALAALRTVLSDVGQSGLMRLFSLRHEFSKDWYRFLTPAGIPAIQTMPLDLNSDRFPYLFHGKSLIIERMELYIDVDAAFAATHNQSTLKVSLDPAVGSGDEAIALTAWQALLRGEKTAIGTNPGLWKLTVWLEPSSGERAHVEREAIRNVVLVCRYHAS